MRVAKQRSLILLTLTLLFGFTANAQNWRQVGPPGGDVQSLAAAPGNARTLYMGTSDGHVFGSRDAGESWQLLGRIGEHHDDVIMSMIVDTRSSDTIYATSWTLYSHGGGVYRSADAGHTWQLIGLEGLVVRAIAQAPSNPNILVAGATAGVYRSDDSGQHWTRISPENHEDLRNFDSVAIDRRDANTIYAGTYHLPWKTTDGGKNWSPAHQGMDDDSDVMSIAVDQNNPNRVFAATCSGSYGSTDGAANWTKFKGIPDESRRGVHIVQDPARPKTVYAGTTTGLWKTTDDGANWRLVTPASWSILSMVIDPQNTDRLILGTERLGVQISDNGGQTYRASNQGFSHRRIADVAIDTQHPERALVVLTNNFEPLLETKDSGRTWTPLATGLKSGPPRHVFASPNGWLAAPVPGGLLRYDSARNSWVSVNQINANSEAGQERRNASLKTASAQMTNASKSEASAKSTVPFRAKVNDMAFGRDAWYAATEEGLMVSRDKGLNWSNVTLPAAPQTTAPSSAVNTASIRTVRTGKSDSYVWALTSRQLEVSGDSGKTWISHALPSEPFGSLHLHSADANTVVLASDRGVFVTRDAGSSWRQANLSELTIEDMTPTRDAVVVSAANGKLFLSRDEGKTWGHMNGPNADTLSALRSREGSNQLVAASETEGLFVLDMGSASSASADSVSSPDVQ